MNIKKYVFIAIGAFVAIVIVAVGVSARFSLSNITADPYQFITDFFNQWSPALGAAGTLIVATLALLAYWQSRRSERVALYRQYLSQVEQWVESERLLLGAVEHLLSVEPDIIFRTEMMRIGAQVRQRGVLVQSAVQALGDSELEARVNHYWDLKTKLAERFDQIDTKEMQSSVEELKGALDQVLSILNNIRGKMLG
jgi:DNA-binding transcriptional regulator of glucitol operon